MPDREGAFLEKILRTIRDEIETRTEHIAGGSCVANGDPLGTGANYLQQVGERNGLIRAESLIHDAIKKLNKGEL